MLSSSTDKNFSHCYGCGLCTLVCPVWHQTHDICCTPHGHAKAMQYGGEINVEGLFDCVLCGACEPVCPENIEIMSMLIELRRKTNNNIPNESDARSIPAILQGKKTPNHAHKVLLLADEALCRHLTSPGKVLLNQVLELLSGTINGTGSVEQAQDNGSDITLALQAE